ncbi:SusC/RagA family TonB-linked outer membrane protein [Sphingobacterium sp. WOUb80]|uniref:SusC/RagA family TonB-linked outer membrane protein n=1 Tax=Sphingobacterium sp. WOUb80 TaxID=3234028 RepID=UPI003CEE1712
MSLFHKKAAGIALGTLFSVTSLYAQQSLTGTVRDANGPIAGVSVSVKGSNRATQTNDNGTFSISASKGETLRISRVGYRSQEITIGSNTVLDINLSNEDAVLDEVIVTALGIKREAKSLGYSAQKVNAADIMKSSPPDLTSGLMGKSAGLNITSSNGIQGNSQRVVIRGNNSILGNNQALIVIDGIQIDNSPLGGQQSKVGQESLENQKDWGSFLNSLNPDDIQEVTVLKGATAAALYGSKGANGVLLITTKKGDSRKGLGIDYNFSTLLSNPYRYSDVQNKYGMGLSSAMWSADNKFRKTTDGQNRFPDPWSDLYTDIPGGFQAYDMFSWFGRGVSWGPELDGTEILWWDGKVRKWDPQPDNRKAFYRTGSTTTHNASFSKTGDFGSFRFGYTRLDNKAILKNSDYQQNNFNLGSSINISNKLKSEVTVSYNDYERKNAPDLGQDFSWGTFSSYNMSREYKPLEFDIYKNADGSKADLTALSVAGGYPYQNNYNQHLFWHLLEQNQYMKRNQLLGSVKLSAEVTPWFNMSGRASIVNANTTVESKYTPVDAAGLQGQYGLETIKNQDVNLEAFGTFHKDKLFNDDFSGSLMIGGSSLRSRMTNVSAWNSGEKDATYGQSSQYPWIIPNKYFLANTSYQGLYAAPIETWANYNINSLFGILDLSYKNYLFLQVTGRNDWSSTLPIKNASYFYPSTSLSFVFTDAFQNLKTDWFNYGKLKASIAGSANGTDAYLANYTYNPYVISNYINGQAPSTFGGMPIRSYKTDLPPADELKPQRNTSQEFGVELGFFKSRLNVEFTYYSTRSKDQILSSSLAGSAGATKVRFNTGELSNKGIEFIVRATPIRNSNFNWDIALNGAHNKNKVISLADGIDIFPLQDLWGNNGVRMYAKAGEDYGTIYGYDYTYKNGQKVVEAIHENNDASKPVVGTRYVTTDDLVPIGNAMPKLTGGLSNTFRYKNFSLYFLSDFKLGGQIYSADYAASMANGTAPETLLEREGGGLPFTYPDGSKANHGVILDGVFADGTQNTDVVHYMYKYAGQYGAWSHVKMPRSNAVFDNTWIKLRELTFTYSIPGKVLDKTGFIQNLDVSLIGRNLFYFYSSLPNNLNPEAINGIGNAQGIQWAQYPGTREYGVSLKVKF